MKAKSIKGKSPGDIQSALQQSMIDGFKPTLAIVFASITQDIPSICNILDTRDINIFGATSCGEFIDGDLSAGGIVILLLDIKKTDFKILLENYDGGNVEDGAKGIAKAVKESFVNPAFLTCLSIIISDIKEYDPDSIIRGFESVFGPGLNMWGGVAGDDKIFHHSVVFTNHQSSPKAILALVINADKIMLEGRAAFGWKPAGTIRTITSSNTGYIYTIDGQPALEIVFKFLGLKLTKEEAVKFIPGSATLCLMRENGAPIMKNINYYNWEEQSVSVGGKIEPGTKFRFALPPDFEVVESITKDAQQLKDAGLAEADALVMFSCISRLDQLGPMVSTEIEGIKNIFNVPMAGFFTFGEYGRAIGGKNEHHNTTCCWVALKEK